MNTIEDIRAKIDSAGDWSAYANNILITGQEGIITLKGPVRSEAERVRLARIAGELVDTSHLRNELVIAPDAAE